MAMLDELGAYLQTNSAGTLGTNIMLSRLPDDPDACVAIFESAGIGPSYVMGDGVAAMDRPRLRVWCRAATNDYPAARAKALLVRNLLGAIRDGDVAGVLCVLSTSEIYPVKFDQEDRVIMGCDYTVWTA